MSNYHLEVSIISRGKGRSVTRLTNYISGLKVRDNYNGKSYYHTRDDVCYFKVHLPENAPAEFHDIQILLTEIYRAEVRYDARTGREFKGSLPNELPMEELEFIVSEYINEAFLKYGLCAIAALNKEIIDSREQALEREYTYSR